MNAKYINLILILILALQSITCPSILEARETKICLESAQKTVSGVILSGYVSQMMDIAVSMFSFAHKDYIAGPIKAESKDSKSKNDTDQAGVSRLISENSNIQELKYGKELKNVQTVDVAAAYTQSRASPPERSLFGIQKSNAVSVILALFYVLPRGAIEYNAFLLSHA